MGNEKISVLAEVEDTTVKYVDFVRVYTQGDSVLLSFMQNLPRENNEERQALLLGNFVFSWPHFASIVKLLNNILSENREEAEAYFKKSMYSQSDV